MRNELEWKPHVMYMEKISNGPINLWTELRAKWDMSDSIDVVITRYKKPQYVAFKSGGPIEMTIEIKLTSDDSETELESPFTATLHGFMRVIFSIFFNKH